MTIARRIPPLTVEGGLLAARTALATEMAWGDGSRVGGFFGGAHKNAYLGTVLGTFWGRFWVRFFYSAIAATASFFSLFVVVR